MKHPVIAGGIAGMMEISVTFPFEYVKTQLQLQQEASAMFAGADKFRNSFHCAEVTVKEYGNIPTMLQNKTNINSVNMNGKKDLAPDPAVSLIIFATKV